MIDTILESFKREYATAVMPRCIEKGCPLGLRNVQRRAILKEERVSQLLQKRKTTQQKASDCIVFVEYLQMLYCVIVELKSQTVHATDVVKKFERSIADVMQVCSQCEIALQATNIIPVVLSKRIGRAERRVLGEKRVIHAGQTYVISVDNCGKEIKDLLATFA